MKDAPRPATAFIWPEARFTTAREARDGDQSRGGGAGQRAARLHRLHQRPRRHDGGRLAGGVASFLGLGLGLDVVKLCAELVQLQVGKDILQV